jgi:hypothetical protein
MRPVSSIKTKNIRTATNWTGQYCTSAAIEPYISGQENISNGTTPSSHLSAAREPAISRQDST